MFRSDRFDRATIVIIASILASVFIFSALLWYSGYLTAKNGNRADHHAQKYEQQAQKDIETECIGIVGSALLSCIAKIVKTTNENQRSEDDLSAQRDMAHWAFLMLIATSATIIVGISGVVFLWRDIQVTRRIGEAQVKAYLVVERIDIFMNNHGQLHCKYQIRNVGQSPAFKFKYGGIISAHFYEDDANARTFHSISADAMCDKRYKVSIAPQTSEVFSLGLTFSDDQDRNDIIRQMASINEVKYVDFRINSSLEWEDVFGNTSNLYVTGEEITSHRGPRISPWGGEMHIQQIDQKYPQFH